MKSQAVANIMNLLFPEFQSMKIKNRSKQFFLHITLRLHFSFPLIQFEQNIQNLIKKIISGIPINLVSVKMKKSKKRKRQVMSRLTKKIFLKCLILTYFYLWKLLCESHQSSARYYSTPSNESSVYTAHVKSFSLNSKIIFLYF